jgi:hypothetical protein
MRRAHLDAQVDLLKPLGELVKVNGAVVVGVDDGHQPLDLRDAQTSLELLRGMRDRAMVSTCMRSSAVVSTFMRSHAVVSTCIRTHAVVSTCMRSRANPSHSAIMTPWHSAIMTPWHSAILLSARSSHLHALDELGGIDLPIAIHIEQVEELPQGESTTREGA